MAQQQRAEEKLKIENMRSESTLPTSALEITQQVIPPPGFLGVMACLCRDPLPVDVHEAPPDPIKIAAMVEPTAVTMSASCIMKDKATWITYIDTMTTSIG